MIKMDWLLVLQYLELGLLSIGFMIEILLILTFLKVPKLRKHPNNYIFWQFI
jgi:hypothetical protein